jgi:hypothetical protein
MNKITVIALSLLPSFFCLSAHAFQVPSLRFGLGYSSLTFTAGQLTPGAGNSSSSANAIAAQNGVSLGSLITLNPMFLWDASSIRARIGVQFLADLGSSYSFMATSGVGIVALFYPMGLSSSREVKDDGSIIRKTRTSPYFQIAVTPTLFTVNIPNSNSSSSNSSSTSAGNYLATQVIETSLGVGVDYPLNENLVGFFGLHYRWAAFTSQETTNGTVSYKGIEALFGVMTDFF